MNALTQEGASRMATSSADIAVLKLTTRTHSGDGTELPQYDWVGCASYNEPCEVCESCTEIRAGNAVDVIEIDAATRRRYR